MIILFWHLFCQIVLLSESVSAHFVWAKSGSRKVLQTINAKLSCRFYIWKNILYMAVLLYCLFTRIWIKTLSFIKNDEYEVKLLWVRWVIYDIEKCSLVAEADLFLRKEVQWPMVTEWVRCVYPDKTSQNFLKIDERGASTFSLLCHP